ncbi:methyl-accepting chemotaxis protein [Marichromatium bheemlicum]|uniref:Methyl-accepting chemotaxis protein n=1 Tax=Marichromatium bheemlicum TaxID=365339 RepID=A0ABX1IA31_9GAMM|nr:methyl-accepting chemotaxis protein [Marichromatium bheemlicum]NKN34066.1 methyl-accepting chemotaxis protein [Marichromatium bheemlicum]
MPKPRRRTSIRTLLVVLLVISVGALAILGGTILFANNAMRDNRAELVELSQTQGHYGAILGALQALLSRQTSILASEDAAQLKSLTPRNPIERQLDAGISALREAVADADTADRHLQALETALATLLATDDRVAAEMLRIHQLRARLATTGTDLDQAFTVLQSHIAELAEELTFRNTSAQIALTRALRTTTADDTTALREAAAQLLDEQVRNATRLGNELQIQTAQLASLAGLLATAEHHDTLMSLHDNRLAPAIARLGVSLDELRALLDDTDTQRIGAELAQDLTDLTHRLDGEQDSLLTQRAALLRARRHQTQALADQRAATATMHEALLALEQSTTKAQQAVFSGSDADMRQIAGTTLAINLIAIVLVIGIGVAILRSVLRPLHGAIAAMRDIGEGEGDLTRRLAPSPISEIDQLAAAFNHFAEKMRALIAEVATASGSTLSHTQQAATIAHRISDHADTHHAEADQVAEALSQLSSSTDQIANGSERAASAAEQVQQKATAGREIVGDSRQAVEQLAAEVAGMAEQLRQLDADTRNVDQVLTVIHAIAEQTNLLALNAAIEAARAGDAGRGFAVVASEVHTLANRTQASTSEISTILERLRGDAQHLAEDVTNSEARAEGAVERTLTAATHFDEIADLIDTIRAQSGEIAAAVTEQSAATTQLDGQARSISESASQMRDGARDAAQISRDLSALAEGLAQAVARFRIDADTSDPTSTPG